MIDIIVLMNNDIDSLIKTLSSIGFQNNEEINTIIINSTNINLDNKLDLFKELNIKIVKTKSSNLKNVGLDNSNSPYILFINSGDLLYNCFAVNYLLCNIEKHNLSIGKIGISCDNKVDFYDDISRYTYGKVYSREFMNKFNLKFNDYLYYSDMAFNKLYLMCKPKIHKTSREVYFTSNSITDDNSKEYIIDYCKSFIDCINIAIKNKLDNKEISKTIFSNMAHLYNKYNINYDKKYIDCIFEYGLDIYNYYLQYKKYLHIKDKDKITIDYRLDINYKYSFEEFLDMFAVKDK